MKKEDLNAILADENAIKQIAARVLDIARQIPREGVVCQGYYCDMSDQLLDRQKTQWVRELKTHELVVDEAILPKVIKEIPLSDEEITQTVIELKTGAKDTLNEEAVLAAARKVLADSLIMARKGSATLKSLEYSYCTICGPTSTSQFSGCYPCGPSNSNNPALYALQCSPCAPNSPAQSIAHSLNCVPCAPNSPLSIAQSQSCVPCAPNGPLSIAHSLQCAPCGPNNPMIGGPGKYECSAYGPYYYKKFEQPQCSALFSKPGCVAAFDPIPDWGRPGDLVEQVSNLQLQLQALQKKLAGR